MSWKRHFRVVRTSPQPTPVDTNRYGGGSSTSANFASYLPLVYAGHPNRIQRYYQFDDMDRDSDINAALDTIADFCTQSEEQTEEPFLIHYNGDPNESESKIITTMLNKWVKLNNFRARLWYMFRDTLKNGDAFFLRDPETQEWLWLDHFMVEMVKVDDTMGKKPDEYLIRGLDYNRQTKFGSKQADPNQYRTPYGTSNIGASRVSAVSMSSAPAAFSLAGTAADPRQRHMLGPFAQEVSVVDAQFVVHLSLSIGNDINWPFGTSILEPIFKVYKQKELLEDAIIIYRVQRAPERRIFYVDVGTMPPERAKRHIEMIKNDIHQRRIPNRTGTGGCFDMATRVPLLDGRTLSLSELATEHQTGKVNWAYSCDPETGAIAPGKITWAGMTRQDAEVVRLTLDNGETIICTPDHKFPILGRGKTAAEDIEIGVDSLVSFNTRLFSINEIDDAGPHYQQVYDHTEKKWKFTHRMVGSFMKATGRHNDLVHVRLSEKKTIIHHGDFNKYNNAPDNLFYMNGYDHFLLHADMTPHLYENMTPEQRLEISEKKSVGGLRSWANSKPERLVAATERLMRNCAEQQQKPWVNQANVLDKRLFDILVETLKANGGGKRQTAAALSADVEFMALYRDLNRPTGKTIVHLSYEKFSVTTLEKLIKEHGYSGWKELLHECGYEVRKPTLGLKTNHEILSAIVAVAQSMDAPNMADVCKRLSTDTGFMDRFAALNADTKGMSNKTKISINTIKVIIGKHGFKDWSDFRSKLSCFNHKVVAIEYMGAMDVGTLTIDGPEEYHGFHTFALEQGVFAFNSILDAAYNPLSINDDYFFAQCERLDTKIPLLDGRTLTLREIIDEYDTGAINWAYSLNLETCDVEPGKITWAGITRRNAELVRVSLTNDEYADTTPDHRFILRDGSEREAAELRPDDLLMPFGTLEQKVKSVEWLTFTEDTGDITVESASRSHVFALAAGIYVHNSADGRGSKVETLPGGEQTGEITDLMFFSRKLARGLRVPISYLNLGEDDSNQGVTFNDGKLGAAMIQEFRFSKYCMRLQSLLNPTFDKEFKRFLIKNGIEMEWSLFELQFNLPQSFTRYRQIELDAQRVQVYQGVSENRRLAERFKFKRFLGMTDDEILENEELWGEENAKKLKAATGSSPAEMGGGDGLSSVGVRPMGDEMPPEAMPGEGEEGADMAGMPGAGGPGAGGMPPPPATAGAAPMGGGMPGA